MGDILELNKGVSDVRRFAKLFDIHPYGQILVVRDFDKEGRPSVLVSVLPPNLGICTMFFSSDDNSEGWKKRDETFDKFSPSDAEFLAKTIFAESFNLSPTKPAG